MYYFFNASLRAANLDDFTKSYVAYVVLVVLLLVVIFPSVEVVISGIYILVLLVILPISSSSIKSLIPIIISPVNFLPFIFSTIYAISSL